MTSLRAPAGYLLLTLALTVPLSLHPASLVPWADVDIDLYLWTLAWDAHAFVTRPWAIFDANIYFPSHLTLAFSENLIGSALFSAPVAWLTGDPVLAMNVASLLACALCGLGAHVLARALGLSPGAAAIAGLIFAFAPPRFLRIGQMHLTAVHWLPFALAFLHQYFDRGRPRDLRLAALFFSLQVLASGHGAVFAVLALGGLTAYRLVRGEPLALGRRVRDLGWSGALALAPAAIILLPYLVVQQEGLRRGPHDYPPANLGSFLASSTHVHAFILSFFPEARINETAMTFLFPGYVPLVLAALAGWTGWRVGRDRTGRTGGARRATWMAWLLELAAVASAGLAVYATWAGAVRLRVGDTVILSMRSPIRAWIVAAACVAARLALTRTAPFDPIARVHRWRERLKQMPADARCNPVPFYAALLVAGAWLSAPPPIGPWPFVYWLPGFNFIRVPSRFGVMALLGLAVIAAAGFDRLARRFAPASAVRLAAVVCLVLVVEFAVVPLPASPYRVEIPAIDRWLATQPAPFAIAELPLPTPEEGGWERRQTLFMLHSMAHWQKTVHGYSGHRPALHVELYDLLRGFPDEASVGRLEALGVDYVVVHRDLYPEGAWPAVDARLSEMSARLRLVHEDERGRVYALPASSRTAAR